MSDKKPNPLTAINLHKFVYDNGLEFNWYENGEELFLYVPFHLIVDFKELIKHRLINEPLECMMKDNGFCFPTMAEFLEQNDIDPKEVFNSEGSHH